MSKINIEVEYTESQDRDMICASVRLPNGRLIRRTYVQDRALRMVDRDYGDTWKNVAGETAVRELMRDMKFSEVL